MKLNTRLLLLPVFMAAQAGLACAAVPSAQEIACAGEDMQVFYYYLSPDPGPAVKERATACHGAQIKLNMPGWLETVLPAMQKRLVWTDPDKNKLSEAQMWQTPVSILYELADRSKKDLLPVSGDKAAQTADLEADYNDIRIRFMMSADRIARAGLEDSFGGRGAAMLATLNAVMERLDSLTGAIAKGDNEGFRQSYGGALKLSRDLFAQLFEAPRPKPAGKFVSKYTPEARLMPGYRGVSLSVPGSQVLFLQRGERIDMLVTFEAIMGSGSKENITATILQNVVVLNVHKPETPGGLGVLQLLCNPVEAQYAALSFAQGSAITIVRRAAGDTEMRPMEIASLRKLFK